MTAPRNTKEDIEARIVHEHYFTAREGAEARDGGGGTYHESLGLLTFCVLVLRNGFTVVGMSACASPENFNAQLGNQYARENAIEQVWPLLGYELKTKLAGLNAPQVTDEMVDRFLSWSLPKDFYPDAGIKFEPSELQKSGVHPWPGGTNLLHAVQAKDMLQAVVEGGASEPA
jgi:hypothetical protein